MSSSLVSPRRSTRASRSGRSGRTSTSPRSSARRPATRTRSRRSSRPTEADGGSTEEMLRAARHGLPPGDRPALRQGHATGRRGRPGVADAARRDPESLAIGRPVRRRGGDPRRDPRLEQLRVRAPTVSDRAARTPRWSSASRTSGRASASSTRPRWPCSCASSTSRPGSSRASCPASRDADGRGAVPAQTRTPGSQAYFPGYGWIDSTRPAAPCAAPRSRPARPVARRAPGRPVAAAPALRTAAR